MKTGGVSKSHDLSQFPEGDLKPKSSIPVGRHSEIPKDAALSAELRGLRSLERKPSKIPNSSSDLQAVNKMIAEHRSNDVGKGKFLLPTQSLGSAERVDSQNYHSRNESGKAPFFFSEFATEKPSLQSVKSLSQGKQDYYAVRHVGKRGRDLFTDEPIEGENSKLGRLKTSPLLSTQSQGTRAIRAFAATATIDKSRGEYVARLHRHVVEALGDEGGVVHLLRPTRDHYAEDSTLNFFTFCEQTELASSLNSLEASSAKEKGRKPIVFTDHKSLVGLSRTSRTEASPIGRLVQQPYFVTSDLKRGDKVVITDDHIQAGGSMLAMEAAAKEAGVDVLALATLSAHPFSPQLTMSSEVSAFLDETLAAWDPQAKVTERLAAIGMPREKLTNSEAMILIAYAIDPASDSAISRFESIQNNLFERAHLHNVGIDPDAPDTLEKMQKLRSMQEMAGTDSARHFIDDAKVLEGEHDSLIPILKMKPASPDEIVKELDQVSLASRSSIQASEVKQVVVLDWDDCLRDEKGLNYKLMHNALAIAAREHASTLPELGDAVAVLHSKLNDAGPVDDEAPLLMKNQKDFSSYLMGRPSIYKRHIIEDFVRKMLPGISEHKAASINNAVYSNFVREYKRLVKPEISKKNYSRDVPFPDIELSLLPGAKEILEKSRNANSRVILISNRGHGDLENEINHLGMMHYFDVVSGAEEVTLEKSHFPPSQMPEDLQKRLINSLNGSDEEALRATLSETAIYAHPDSTTIGRIDKKPDSTRLAESLERLSVQPNVPITSYGDQPSDIKQLKNVAEPKSRVLKGVIVNAQRDDVGREIDVDGVPTRVVSKITEL
ncbi:type III secretion system effector protein XopC [Xanthomonas sp. D-99]|uniref:type III secretion system effector protein XopC n=1 Tax=Xanthomonas sp. D-99 TaxID=2821273 RepID=UPI001FD42DDE|nr:type III secretion system effector protein XopC [Xanthomonas sp. D-99]